MTEDGELFAIIRREEERQNTTLQLIASENFASRAVMAATGSVLTNKYSEGYPGKRYYGGNQVIDEAEDLARRTSVQAVRRRTRQRAAPLGRQRQPGRLPGRARAGRHRAGHAPRPGRPSHPRLAGERQRPALPLRRPTASPRATSASTSTSWPPSPSEHRPKLIVAGATAYPRIIDPEPFRDIADEVGALFMFDAAHVAGLIAGGVHPNPVGVADIVTFTTHKTLRGPRGGCILCRAELAPAIDKAVFPGLQGGPLEHVIAAKAVAFREAAQPEFRDYAAQIVRNARALAEALAGEGFRIVSGGTDNHLMLVDLRAFDAELTGKVAQEALDRAGITLNKNSVPGDPRSPFVTSGLAHRHAGRHDRGHGRSRRWREIGRLIGRVLRRPDDAASWPPSASEVAALLQVHPLPVGARTGELASQATADYIIVGAVAALATWLCTFVVRRLAVRFSLIVLPDERRVHERPTPTARRRGHVHGASGGHGRGLSADGASSPLFRGSSDPLGLVLAASVIFAVGMVDDVREMSPPAKLSGQILAGTVLYLFGINMLFFRVPFARHHAGPVGRSDPRA